MVCPTEICSIIDENNQTLLWLTLECMSIFGVIHRNGMKSAGIGYLNLKLLPNK